MTRTHHTQPAPTDFQGLSDRLSAAILSGDAVATDRAIRCARGRGDFQEVERLTADYWRIQGSGNAPLSAAHTDAAVLARIPLIDRIGRS